MIEDNPAEQLGDAELLGHDDIDVVGVGTGAEALKALDEEQIDCAVLDLRLPDMSGFELLKIFRDDPALSDLPVVVFTGGELSPEEDAQLHTFARSVLVKGCRISRAPARRDCALRRGMNVPTATTGSEAIALVESTPSLAIVLMNIMMPEMDGYQTTQVIRANPAFRRLPIIALTAKAMKGDREKCLEAGASDYLAKPVDTEQLLSALRMWLRR